MNEMAGSAYLYFTELGGYSKNKNCVSLLICFDAVITDAKGALALNLHVDLSANSLSDDVRLLDSLSLLSVESSSSGGRTIFEKRFKKIKLYCHPLLQASYFIDAFRFVQMLCNHTPIMP